MSNYRMTLIVGGREINIPVLPAKLNVSSPGKNERVTVLDLGEVLLYVKGPSDSVLGKFLSGRFRAVHYRTGSGPYFYYSGNPESQGQQNAGPLPDNRNRPGL